MDEAKIQVEGAGFGDRYDPVGPRDLLKENLAADNTDSRRGLKENSKLR